MSAASSGVERLQDLIVQRTLEGITLNEANEISLLTQAHPDADIDGIEAAVAALDAIPFGETPPLPAAVGDAIMARFEAPPSVAVLPRTSPASPAPWVALAATLVIAAMGWYQALTPERAPATPGQMPIAQMPDAGRWDFAPTGDPAGQDINGEVRWTTAGQRGEMQLSGLAPNDPSLEQYQLWIFDATRDEATPVDGGVFDIASAGNELVSIRPTLQVREPTMFAITIEPPGGVMVSDRERLIAFAKVP